MKKSLSLLFGLLAPWVLQAQIYVADSESERGYYLLRDSVLVKGVHIGTVSPDRLLIPRQRELEERIYTPDEVLAYGFENGVRYFSMELPDGPEPRRVFLREVVDCDDFRVFVYEKGTRQPMYLYRGDTLTRIDDVRQLQGMLRSAAPADCDALPYIDRANMRLTPTSVGAFYRAYRDCNTKAVSRPIRWGVSASVCFNRIIRYRDQDFVPKQTTVSPGLFLTVPIAPTIDVVTELVYRHVSTDFSESGCSRYRRQSLGLPILLRGMAAGLKGRWMPYGELGGIADFRLRGEVRECLFDYDGLPDGEAVSPIAGTMFGVVVGAGVECRFTPRRSLFLSVRYTYQSRGVEDSDRVDRYKCLSINTGFSF